MGMRIGVCGAGSFASSFIPLFKAHPLVDEVVLARCSRSAAPRRRRASGSARTVRLARRAVRHGRGRDRHLHPALAARAAGGAGPARRQARLLRRAGRRSPWTRCGALVRAVEETGLIYMTGETSYYYPAALYCRRALPRRATSGDFVYGEGEYLHDMSHGFYAGLPAPRGRAAGSDRLLPAHALPDPLGQHDRLRHRRPLTHVSCLGYVDREDDGVFRAEVNLWGNTFSNETALFRTSDGGMCRINEFRRVGLSGGDACACPSTARRAASRSRPTPGSGTPWRDRTQERRGRAAGCRTCRPAGERASVAAALQDDFFNGVCRRASGGSACRASSPGCRNGH